MRILRLPPFLPFAFCLLPFALPTAASAQFTQRGYLETTTTLFPQTAPGDSSHAIGEWLLRYEPAWKVFPWLKFQGSFDARADTHRQVERDFRLDWRDRSIEQPAFSVRRLSATLHSGKWTAELGKQFIRWGKADILNPTDRFAPRDFLTVVDNDFLAVTGARLTYEAKSDTIDLVWVPLFTPSRTPLLNQRWVVLSTSIPIAYGESRYPGGSQEGIRWNHLGRGYEASLSFFDGSNHLPLIDPVFSFLGTTLPIPPGGIVTLPNISSQLLLQRRYAHLRMYGGDFAMPLHWFTVKTEAAYFTSPTSGADEYLQYVIQLERVKGEWSFTGGYAGEYVSDHRTTLDFAPDRGLTKAFIGRADYTIDAARRVAFQFAERQNGAGTWASAEYSQMIGAHWRATAGFNWIRGNADDFLGEYKRNSHLKLALRYSF
jgi:hypothetical protein